MSLLESQNKRIAKVLGLCWHEWSYTPKISVCLKCKTEDPQNISFDTWEGFRLIIENGPKMEWWNEFIRQNRHVFVITELAGKPLTEKWAIKHAYIGPKLAVALNEFLEGGR